MDNLRSFQRLEFAIWLAIATVLLTTTLGAQTPPAPPIMLGTAWYPEQWPESRWESDLGLMEQAGIRMVSCVKPALGAAPDGVEVYPRYGDRGAVYILVNLSKVEQTVAPPSTMNDVLEGGSKQSVKLPVYGVAILSK
jgi:beta-galactosidase GanA